MFLSCPFTFLSNLPPVQLSTQLFPSQLQSTNYKLHVLDKGVKSEVLSFSIQIFDLYLKQMHVDLNYYFKIVSGHIHIKTRTSGDVGTLRDVKLDYWTPLKLGWVDFRLIDAVIAILIDTVGWAVWNLDCTCLRHPSIGISQKVKSSCRIYWCQEKTSQQKRSWFRLTLARWRHPLSNSM